MQKNAKEWCMHNRNNMLNFIILQVTGWKYNCAEAPVWLFRDTSQFTMWAGRRSVFLVICTASDFYFILVVIVWKVQTQIFSSEERGQRISEDFFRFLWSNKSDNESLLWLRERVIALHSSAFARRSWPAWFLERSVFSQHFTCSINTGTYAYSQR